MKTFRSRIFLGSASIVLALIVCFFAAPYFTGIVNAQATVVRVAKPIAQGSKITPDMLELVTVGAYNLPASVIRDIAGAEGLYAVVPMLSGDYLTPEKFTAEMTRQNPYLYTLPQGKLALSIPITSFAAGLSGKLQAGDIVSILNGSPKNTNHVDDSAASYQSMDLLSYVKVLAVTLDNGADSNLEHKTEYAPDGSEKKYSPATVTLEVSPRQAALLVTMDKTHLVLVYRGDEAVSQAFLEQQQAYEDMLAVIPKPPADEESVPAGEAALEPAADSAGEGGHE